MDQSDCQELGIVDETACEFAPWAIERCPMTCGKCNQDPTGGGDYKDYEEYTSSYDYNEDETRSDEASNKDCVDSEDCKELGILDLDSCEFAPWAPERCPVTCNTC